jgi:two-component system chemotaxis sensor kinase CheA
MVASRGSSFCIDSEHVIKIEVIAAGQIQKSENKEFLQCENGALPIVRLRELLGQPADETLSTELQHIVTCEFPEKGGADDRPRKKRVGIIVDKVVGSEEVLARNLGSHSSRWPGIAGATELRDGTVALVLDLPRIFQALGVGQNRER